ncbi:hypothetical protein [Vibrio cincinnatiensis]|uniref:hypothetical protein n=1 Tax=Vibrio cincinnatiensis TaxID=675 RepID=UPI001FAA497F|nr:hypothetical protein [Vibrio cincinnatiensis]
MFKIEKTRLVKAWPATVELPSDGGEIQKEKITLDLLILDTEENARLLRGDEAALKKVIKGWSGIGNEDGKAMEFNDENVSLLIKNQFFVIALLRAYQQASNGQAAEKN